MSSRLHIGRALLFLAVWTVATTTYGQDLLERFGSRDDPRFGEAARNEADRRKASIHGELERLASPHWAGDYYAGDGLGVNLYIALAPEAGFTFEWHGCLGVYDRNWGTVVVDGDRIRLEPEFTNYRRGFQGVAEEFRWVQWGERTYLLPDGDVAPFCNGINDAGEPEALLERSDADLPLPPVELLPADIRACVLEVPLTAALVEVDVGPLQTGLADWSYRTATGTIDVGSDGGVFEGMALYLQEGVERGEVTEVAAGTAKVEFTVSEDDPVPKVGALLGSRAPWRQD